MHVLKEPPKPLPIEKVNSIERNMFIGFVLVIATVIAVSTLTDYKMLATFILFGGTAMCFGLGIFKMQKGV